MRKGTDPDANTAEGTAPAPPIWGVKKRAATLENTASAENPCRLGTLTRPAYPGIFDRSHSTGNVIGVLPRTLKSYPLCVYFQIYSPENTRYFPNACSSPAWNSLRHPGASGVGWPASKHPSSGFSTALLQPSLDRIKFSLNGVSSTRAYETLSTVLVFLML